MGSSRAAKRVPGWWWCRGPDRREGWAPAEFLAIEGGEATVSREYDAHELSVSTGEDVEVLEDIAGWARVTNGAGLTRWIPMHCVAEGSV
jgi:hypothetical protein